MKLIITVEVPDGAAVTVNNGADAGVATEAAAKKGPGRPRTGAVHAPDPTPTVTTAAVAAGAEVPATPAPPPSIAKVNAAISLLAGKDRDKAIEILLRHGASKVKTTTSQLKPDVYQLVIDDAEEAVAAIDAAATQLQNTGSLVG